MSREAWGDEGNIPYCWEDTQMFHDLADIQRRLYKFHEAYFRNDFPNNEFVDAYGRADEAIQDMFGQMEGEL